MTSAYWPYRLYESYSRARAAPMILLMAATVGAATGAGAAARAADGAGGHDAPLLTHTPSPPLHQTQSPGVSADYNVVVSY